jgi:hypothetical protein
VYVKALSALFINALAFERMRVAGRICDLQASAVSSDVEALLQMAYSVRLDVSFGE